MEAAFFIWILCGIGAAIAAVGKGRSGCGWFLLGVLLGPFGLLFAVLSSNKTADAARTSDQAKADKMKKCPICAEFVMRDAIKCRFCGADLPS